MAYQLIYPMPNEKIFLVKVDDGEWIPVAHHICKALCARMDETPLRDQDSQLVAVVIEEYSYNLIDHFRTHLDTNIRQEIRQTGFDGGNHEDNDQNNNPTDYTQTQQPSSSDLFKQQDLPHNPDDQEPADVQIMYRPA